MADSLDAVKARTRALLSKTVAAGCTEGEALAAAEKAAALLRQHGLDRAQVLVERARHLTLRLRRHPIDRIWGYVAHACRCRVVEDQAPDLALIYVYIGHAPWPEIAIWLAGALTQAHDRALKAFRRSGEYEACLSLATRATARTTFSIGWADQVRVKLLDLAEDDVGAPEELLRLDHAIASETKRWKTVAGVNFQAGGGATGQAALDAGRAAGRATNVAWGLGGRRTERLAGSK